MREIIYEIIFRYVGDYCNDYKVCSDLGFSEEDLLAIVEEAEELHGIYFLDYAFVIDAIDYCIYNDVTVNGFIECLEMIPCV
jgi:hypothetical protein